MIRDIQDEILRLKKEYDICILAHSYQAAEIIEVADITGDSYKLSVEAAKVQNRNILMCGVHFMAETAKMLSPDKRVFLAHRDAGCPMAEQFEPEMITAMKKQDPRPQGGLLCKHDRRTENCLRCLRYFFFGC